MSLSTILTSNGEDASLSSFPVSITSNSSSKRGSSVISKTYKQASTLFLTRRLPEALQTLEPLISTRSEDSSQTDGEADSPAPIAIANKSTRVKVWNLYLTLLNAIIDLGPEDGKSQFGNQQWRGLVAKARDSTIWEEIIRVGYHGNEGDVDADVVANIATLLLSQSTSQTINQQRLETYLSASSNPNLDLSGRFENSSQHGTEITPHVSHSNGTDTPRDLNNRIKILELYALHVLPRNEEWEYAREFINMSEVLDEERREAFLQALQAVQEQQNHERDHEANILQKQEEDLKREQEEAEMRRLEESRLEEERSKRAQDLKGHKRSNSEKDYGIEEDPIPGKIPKKSTGVNKAKSSKQSSQTQGKLSPVSRDSGVSKKIGKGGVYKRSTAILA